MNNSFTHKIQKNRGAWVAQSVMHLILGFSSGHHLTVHEFEGQVGLCVNSAEPAWDSLSPSLCSSLLAFSPSQNKQNKT